MGAWFLANIPLVYLVPHPEEEPSSQVPSVQGGKQCWPSFSIPYLVITCFIQQECGPGFCMESCTFFNKSMHLFLAHLFPAVLLLWKIEGRCKILWLALQLKTKGQNTGQAALQSQSSLVHLVLKSVSTAIQLRGFMARQGRWKKRQFAEERE